MSSGHSSGDKRNRTAQLRLTAQSVRNSRSWLKSVGREIRGFFSGAVIVAAIPALVAIVGLFLRKEKGAVAVDGDGTVVGNNATVLVDKRQGIDSEFLYSQNLQLAEAKGGLEIELEQAREERDKAISRVEEIEAQGNRPDAKKVLRELRGTGDMTALQILLIEERDKHRDLLIQRIGRLRAWLTCVAT